MVRLFVAVYPIPFREKLYDAQKRILRFFEGKLVERQNFHITLSFLGNVDENKISSIEEKLSHVCSHFKPFEITVDGIEFIPSKKYIRVLAFKVSGVEIFRLSETVGKTVGGDVKPPHLTIARVKRIFDKKMLLEICEKIKLEENMTVDSIKLMKSELKPHGPIYTVLKTFTFNK